MIAPAVFQAYMPVVSYPYGEPVTSFADAEHKRLDVPAAVLYNEFTPIEAFTDGRDHG
jgi:hypothetical protein